MPNLTLTEAQEIVRAKYPDAWARWHKYGQRFIICYKVRQNTNYRIFDVSEYRETEHDAWLSAAERIKKQENENI